MRTKERILNHRHHPYTHPFGDRLLEVLIDIRDIHHGLLIEATHMVDRLDEIRDAMPTKPYAKGVR